MSVRLLVGLLPYWNSTQIHISPILDDISFWFLKTFLGFKKIFPNDSEFLVCLSICQLAYFLTEIRQIQGYLKFWMRYLSEIFGDIPGMLVHYFQIILNFMYVCQSVSWNTSLLKLYKYRDTSSSGRNIFLKSSGDIPRMNLHWFQIILNFLYVCQSVSWLTFLPN